MSGIHFGDHQETIGKDRFMNTSDINGPQFKSQMRRRNLSAAKSGAEILGSNPAGVNQKKVKRESFQDIMNWRGHDENQAQSKQELYVKPVAPIPDQEAISNQENYQANRMDAKLRAMSQNSSNLFGHYNQTSQFEEYPQHLKNHAGQNPSEMMSKPPGSRGSQATRISQKTHGRVKPPKVPAKIEGVSITQDATMMDYDQFGRNIVNPTTDIGQYQVPKRIDDSRQAYVQGISANNIFGNEQDLVPQRSVGKKMVVPRNLTSQDNLFSNPRV